MRGKKIIHLSALGIENFETEYAKSKLAAEKYLKILDVPAVILKPSFVYGQEARGGMRLIRALSVLPLIVPLPGNGRQKFQPVYVKDLAHAIVNFAGLPLAETVTLAAVSLHILSLKEMMTSLRKWLGTLPGWTLPVPLLLIKMGAWFGNRIPFSSLNTDAVNMLTRNNVTTPAEAKRFACLSGINPVDFKTGLNRLTAGETVRWQAKLFFLKPMLRFSLAFMWLASAVSSVLPGTRTASLRLLKDVGMSFFWQPWILYSASLLNALIGIALLINFKTVWNCRFQMVLVLLYTTPISCALPWLWLEPFGPVVKNIPVLVSIMLLAVFEEK